MNHYLRYGFIGCRASDEATLHYVRACPEAQHKYDALKKAKNWKTARLAIARRIATTVYRMLIEKRDWKEEATKPERPSDNNGHGG